jgi:hypothetical protein
MVGYNDLLNHKKDLLIDDSKCISKQPLR